MLNQHARLSKIAMYLLVTVLIAMVSGVAIGSELNVLLYSGGSVTQITNDNNSRNPRINDLGHLVWKGVNITPQIYSRIFFYNGTIKEIINSDGGYTPDIGKDDKIVYAAGGLYFCDGNSTTKIVNSGWAP
jgi:hypothetical protein